MEELVPFVIVWWMALTPVAAFYLLRHLLVDDFPSPSGLTADDWAELEHDPDWQAYLEDHRQRQERWRNAPVILRIGWSLLLVTLRLLWLAVKVVFLPCVIAYWIGKAADKWWSPLPIAVAIKNAAGTEVKCLAWLDDLHGRPR